MSRKDKILQEAIKQLRPGQSQVYSGIITYVDEDHACCTLHCPDGLLLEGVQLKTLKNNNCALLIVPAINSWAHVLDIGAPNYLLLSCELMDKCLLQTNDSLLQLDADGLKLQHRTESLGSILNELLNQIMALTVPTNAGQSGVPLNMQNLNTIQQRINNLFS
jgi:phosphatidylserine/phosphatidylglycerophosphate/cardiolipin synthase-like enzyme